MYDNSVTRYRFGMTNARDTETYSDLPVQDFSKFHDYLEDFDYYVGPVTATTTNGYTLSGTGATAALAAADGGVVNLIGATTGFIATLQRSQGSFKAETGKRIWYGALLTLDSLANIVIAGLTEVNTTPFTAVNHGVYFLSTVTTGELNIVVSVNGVLTTVDTGVQMVAGQQASLKWYWDGGDYGPTGRIVWEASGPGVTAPARGVIAAPANFPEATLLAPVTGIKGTAGTPTLAVDLLMAIKERANINSTPAF
jgi:hypothetical protein